jgi:hypothetical protein
VNDLKNVKIGNYFYDILHSDFIKVQEVDSKGIIFESVNKKNGKHFTQLYSFNSDSDMCRLRAII